jgi:ribosomal protein S27AE
MIVREIVSFDGRSGEVRHLRAPSRRLRRRIARLRERSVLLEHVATLSCDRCGLVVELDPVSLRLPDGWCSDDRGELCPECHGTMLA